MPRMKSLWFWLVLGSLPASAARDGGVDLFDVTPTDAAVGQAGDGLRSLFPPSWLLPSWFGLQRWQWIAVPVVLALSALLTLLLVRFTAALVRRFRKDPAQAEQIVHDLSGPLKLGWACLLARLALPFLALSPEATEFWQQSFRLGLLITFFWGAVRIVSAWGHNFAGSAFGRARPGSRALVSLASQVIRIALMCFGVLAALSELGYSVTSVLAGLGIGGLALALGAQKTLENLFGAFALAVDQPIREGDFVRIEDFVGTVENIGLRSTRVRTLDRTVISIPNGKLADMRLETFGSRDRVRMVATVGLAYSTTSEQMKQVLEGLREALRAQAELWPDAISVNFVKLGDSALEVEVMAWFVTTDFEVFKRARQEVLLRFLAVVEKAGTSIAFPTRTVHLVSPPPPEAKES